MKTPAEIQAGNQHASYMRGWRDGACVTAMRKEFVERAADEPLRVAYELGYSEGIGARNSASRDATARYGHEPSILRLAETP